MKCISKGKMHAIRPHFVGYIIISNFARDMWRSLLTSPVDYRDFRVSGLPFVRISYFHRLYQCYHPQSLLMSVLLWGHGSTETTSTDAALTTCLQCFAKLSKSMRALKKKKKKKEKECLKSQILFRNQTREITLPSRSRRSSVGAHADS